MLSTFEAALLDRHLRRCVDCRAFAADLSAHTALLRGAELEQPSRRVELPTRRAGTVRRGALGMFAAGAAAAAVALALVTAGGREQSANVSATASVHDPGVGKPVLVVVPARPSLTVSETVPRLKVRPASIADGPVHGLFSLPV